ncbi:60 kDa SS-A/Ro ribonucleoprotein [Ixodes scapularis]|uniref:60 kDa SS-A/Ro ribonucleoprotein n=1 Tax=Ixodes scapularis TaxID=6945 RepID=UPI001A9FEBBA|nr:60 kDa SS-A/Ro ribonucleoprotein [Ixodes scapularis]
MAEDAALARLRRFLYTGLEGNRYQPGRRDFSAESVQSVPSLLADKRGVEVVKEVLCFAKGEPKTLCPDALAYVLALCAASDDAATKTAAYRAFKEVCSSPTQLFAVTRFLESVSQGTGWGRAHRNAVAAWYTRRKPRELAAQVTKVVCRHRWTHQDVIRLAHVRPPASNLGVSLVLRYLTKGFQAAEEYLAEERAKGVVNPEAAEVLAYLRGVHEVKRTSDEQTAARLVEMHDLALEHVPTHFLKSKEMWVCLVPRLPLRLLLEQLPRLARGGLLRGGCLVRPLLERLQSDNSLADSGCPLGPLETYALGRCLEGCSSAPGAGPSTQHSRGGAHTGGKRGHRHHRSQLEDVLASLHVSSFKTLPTTGKRYLVAVDVRSPMAHGRTVGLGALTPAEASGLLLQALARAETGVTALAFSARGLVDMEINNKMTLSDISRRMRETPMGPVNVSLPLRWAREQKRPFDLFLVCTDNQTQAWDVHPAEALKEYREALNLPQAQLVTCAMCSHGFSLAPPDEFGMLDIAGFDTNVLRIIQDFASGLF